MLLEVMLCPLGFYLILGRSFSVSTFSFTVALTLPIMSATGNITPCCMAINLVLPHYGPRIIEQELWNEVFGSMDLFSFTFF